VSPPTCLRRVKRLRDAGLIERQIAILNDDLLAPLLGHGLSAIVEITLDRQGAERLDAFEQRVAPTPPYSSATACRRGRTSCWWCTRPTCRAIWRWRSDSSPRRECAQRQGLL
jgi:DNA-binding Lrp family transcriptional regulator